MTQRSDLDHHNESDYPPARRTTKARLHWFQHLAAFAAGQTVLALLGYSWALEFLQGTVPVDQHWLMTAGRIWLIAFAADTIWTWGTILLRSKQG